MVTTLLIIFGLILLNGVLVMAEMALVSARRPRLKDHAERGNAAARIALDLAADPSRFLSTVQIGITLIGTLTAAYGGAEAGEAVAEWLRTYPPLAPYAHTLGLGGVVIAIALATLLLGELLPKRLALANPETIAIALARPLRWMGIVTGPISWLLSLMTDALLRLFPKGEGESHPVTDEEIKIMMREGAESGHFQEAERNIVEMTLRLGDKRVSALMTPRTQIQVIDLDDSPETNLQRLRDSEHSCMPVIQGGFERVLGVVHKRDLFRASIDGQPVDPRASLRPALYIPETVPALKALEQFKSAGTPIALIVDEYGDIQGLVTLTDLMAALVGDIADQPGETPEAVQRADGSWLIDGMMSIDAALAKVGLPRHIDGEDADYSTVGGFMMARLKRIPAPADFVDIAGFRFEVMDMDGHRVDKILVMPPKA